MNASPVDHVIVVDTSGSMWRALPLIAEWLGQLEYLLARSARSTGCSCSPSRAS